MMKNVPHQASCIVLVPHDECPIPADCWGIWLDAHGPTLKYRRADCSDHVLDEHGVAADVPADAPYAIGSEEETPPEIRKASRARSKS